MLILLSKALTIQGQTRSLLAKPIGFVGFFGEVVKQRYKKSCKRICGSFCGVVRVELVAGTARNHYDADGDADGEGDGGSWKNPIG